MGIIRSARKAKGLTLRQLSEQSGISNPYISQLESGKIKRPSAVSLYTLAGILDVDFDSLMVEYGFVDPKNQEGYMPNNLLAMKLSIAEERELMAFLTHIRTFSQ